MARRKKRSSKKQIKTESPEALEQSAAEHLEQGRFRDAADEYKRLLKETSRPEWVRGLAEAYAGRAEHLASRGMIKEAIALWQNRAETCDQPLADPRYLKWLLAADRTPEIIRLYREAPQALAGDDGLTRLQECLAARALADGGDLIADLADNDPVARDFATADKALEAYADHDDDALQAALARIPFRSVYRDFRQLMKALLMRERDREAAAELLARVPIDTPFAGMRQALEAAGALDAYVYDQPAFAGLPRDILTVTGALAGWRSEQQQIVAPLTQLGPAPNEPALFDFVMTHRKALGGRFGREAAFALVGTDTRRHARLAKIHKAFAPEEYTRLLALLMEAGGEPWEAVDQ